MEYRSDLDEIHSFDSYFGKIQKENDSIIIPFVNLGVSEHPLHRGNSLKYINKAYLVFEGVTSFEEQYSLSETEGLLTFYFGGFDVAKKENREFKVVCKDAYLKIMQDSKLSDEMWAPIIKIFDDKLSKLNAELANFLGV